MPNPDHAAELDRLRDAATGTYWERYGYIGRGSLSKVRCPSGCDSAGRQLYTDIPSSDADAKFIVYCANHAKAIAAELRELRAERDALIQDRDDWKMAAEAEAAAHDEARDELREIHERDL